MPPIITGPRTQDGYPVTSQARELFRMVSGVFRWPQISPDIKRFERPVAPEAEPAS